jgi:phosphate starvation-inducible protein PhoH and related proteins
VHFIRLTSHDVVRHRLVSEIVDAYAKYDAENAAPTGPRSTTSRRAGGARSDERRAER